MSSVDRREVEQPRWANDQWRREHLRAWGIKERLAHEPPGWKAKRAQWAAEAAAKASEFPSHIANLQRAAANSEAPLRPEVLAELHKEIERRIAALKE